MAGPRGKGQFQGVARTTGAPPSRSLSNRMSEGLRGLSLATLLQVFAAFSVAVIALLVWRVSKASIHNLSDASPDALRDVFFGDKPWVVYCASPQELQGAAAVPQLYTLLHQDLGSEASFGILDCSAKLPSGKTIQQRFNIDAKWSPAIAAFVPWDKHRQVPPSAIKDHISARRFLRPLLDPIPYHAHTMVDINKRCASANCVVLASSSERYKHTKDLQRAIVRANPRTRFVHIDQSALRLPELSDQQALLSVAVLKKLNQYRIYNGPLEVGPVRSFIQASMVDAAELSELPVHALTLPATSEEKKQKDRQKREQFQQAASEAKRSTEEPSQSWSAEDIPEFGADLTPEQLQRKREMERREAMDRLHEEIVSVVDPDEYDRDAEEEDYEEEAVIDLD